MEVVVIDNNFLSNLKTFYFSYSLQVLLGVVVLVV